MSGEGDDTTRDPVTEPQRPARPWPPAPAIDPAAPDWEQISELVETALELGSEERSAWLGILERRQPGLVSEVRRVLDWLGGLSAATSANRGAGVVEADPQRIGAYRLVQLIGRGGMGSVYLAERADDEFEHQVAIKVVSAGFDAPIVHRRFLAERQILARFEHPNIARLYEGGTTADGRPYFVLEYVQGLPIDRWCDEQGLSLSGRLELFIKVCDAVAYAHRNLVVHRDLKPGNILVDGEGQPKLLDFGIAKVLDPTTGNGAEATRTVHRAMTPGYASPEQIRGGVMTTATDVYSLGVLLYKLLTGQMPHQFDNLAPTAMLETMQRAPLAPSERLSQAVVADEPLPLFGETSAEQVSRLLRGDLDNIVGKAIRLEPESRYASVSALTDDLQRFLAGETVLATRGSALYRLRKAARRYRWPLLVVASLLTISFGWALMLSRQVAATVTERDRARATRDFLVDLMRSADEQGRTHKLIPLEDLLARAYARLEDETRPLEAGAKADLFEVLGDAFVLFSDRTQAIAAYEKALALLPASETAARVRLLHNKGTTELYSDRFDGAATSFRTALAEVPAKDAVQRARLISFLAVVSERNLKTAEALSGLRSAAALLGSNGLAENADISFTLLQNFVFILDRNLEPRAARLLACRAYRHFSARQGPDSPEAFFFVAWVGMVDVALNDAEAAVLALREAQRIQALWSHDHDPNVLWLLDGLSAALVQAGRIEEGLAVQDQILAGLARLIEVDAQSGDINQVEILVRLTRCDLLRRLGREQEIPAEAERLLILLREPSVYPRHLQNAVALAFLGRREEAKVEAKLGLEGGWGWSRTVAVLEPLGVLPDPMPRPQIDFSLPPELEAMLGPPSAEPLPWELPR